MSSSVGEEERKRYEKEFIEFLTQRINHAGGSLQFQHLSGVLQQLNFEVKEAFGTNKAQLMKFLRSHPGSFKVDFKGIVTIVNSPTVEEFNDKELTDSCSNLKSTKNLLPKIENGEGRVTKITPEFGLIASKKPVLTYIYFTPSDYNKLNNKESLFIDHDLEINSEVCFNAVCGHHDHEVQYLATKVWKKPVENACPEACEKKSSKNIEKGAGKGRSKVDLKAQKKAVEAIKFSEKSHSEPSSHFETAVKDCAEKRELFRENQKGKIYPCENGSFIKFGKNDSELVDGSSCDYFLYGLKIKKSDIRYEFSEGDDVFFDAKKRKNAPDWIATLIWTGEKPDDKDRNKMCIEESDENEDDQSEVSETAAASVNSYCLSRNKTSKPKLDNFSTKQVTKKSNNSFVHGMGIRRDYKSDLKSNFNNSKHMKSNVKKTINPLLKPRSKMNESKKKNWGNKFKGVSKGSTELNESSSSENEYVFSSRETRKLSKRDPRSSGDTEFQNVTENCENFQKENKSSINSGGFKFKHFSDEEVDSEDESYETTPESPVDIVKGKASIKTCEDIEGKITRLYCKAALVESPCLQENIDFILNTFYLNGKSVEDQNVIDLKEILKVGDNVKFNCFIIIDDNGDTYQKATMVWKGIKPENVREMSPEEFIEEFNLSVSVPERDIDGNEFEQEYENIQNNFSSTVERINSDYAANNFSSQTESHVNNVSEDLTDESAVAKDVRKDMGCTENGNNLLKNVNDDTSDDTNDVIENDVTEDGSDSSVDMNCIKDDVDYTSEDDVSFKLLSEKIIQKLKDSGVISSGHQVETSSVINEVSLILEKYSIKESSLNQPGPLKCSYLTDSPEVLCTKCTSKKSRAKQRTVNAEVQTIITGEVVATRDKFPFTSWKMKLSR